MKKLFFFAVLAIFGMTASSAQEGATTGGFHWGVKGGANFSSVNGDDVNDVDSRTGIQIGAVASFEVTELFSVQPEVIYSMRGWKDGNVTIKLDYVDVPVVADFEIIEGLSLQGGPLFGINLSAKVENEDGNENDIEDISTLNIGAAIGAQYDFPMGLFLNIRYDMGFNDVIDNNFDAKNCNLGASVGFMIQ